MKNEINKYIENIPKIFEISYGAYLGPFNYFSLKLEDGKFLHPSEFFDSNEIIPSEEEWKDFWIKMDQISIWNWLEHYYPQNIQVLDGYYWNLKIQLGNNKIESSGSNAYPGDNGEIVDMAMTIPFKMFLDAIENLTGLEIKRYDD